MMTYPIVPHNFRLLTNIVLSFRPALSIDRHILYHHPHPMACITAPFVHFRAKWFYYPCDHIPRPLVAKRCTQLATSVKQLIVTGGFLKIVSFTKVGSSLFLLSVCFCLCSLFYRDDVLAGYFLPVLFCMLSMLISDSRLIWFGSVYLVTTAGFVADQLM